MLIFAFLLIGYYSQTEKIEVPFSNDIEDHIPFLLSIKTRICDSPDLIMSICKIILHPRFFLIFL